MQNTIFSCRCCTIFPLAWSLRYTIQLKQEFGIFHSRDLLLFLVPKERMVCCFMQACFIPNYSEVLFFMGKWLQGIRSAPWHVIFSLQGVHFYALQGNIGTALLLSNLLGLLVSSYLIPHFLSHVRQKKWCNPLASSVWLGHPVLLCLPILLNMHNLQHNTKVPPFPLSFSHVLCSIFRYLPLEPFYSIFSDGFTLFCSNVFLFVLIQIQSNLLGL